MRGRQNVPLLFTCSLGLNPLFKAQKRLIDEPREEMQEKRKTSEAEEEKDEQRFAFKILKAPFTPGIKAIAPHAGVNIMQ